MIEIEYTEMSVTKKLSFGEDFDFYKDSVFLVVPDRKIIDIKHSKRRIVENIKVKSHLWGIILAADHKNIEVNLNFGNVINLTDNVNCKVKEENDITCGINCTIQCDYDCRIHALSGLNLICGGNNHITASNNSKIKCGDENFLVYTSLSGNVFQSKTVNAGTYMFKDGNILDEDDINMMEIIT